MFYGHWITVYGNENRELAKATIEGNAPGIATKVYINLLANCS